jgi:Tfp pilus assembly ATPase PilU
MDGGYELQDLLDLLSSEAAERLSLQVGKPPVLYLRGEEHVVEGPPVTRENATGLFCSLASPEQIRELDSCGDVRFIYTSPKAAKFGVRALRKHEDTTLEIRNLAVPPSP